ncbi:MAG: TIGR04219 family outer membrane beta-barrel protein [Parashewanella sp.]
MKKSILLASMLFAGASQAASVVGVKFGGEAWSVDTSGSISPKNNPSQTYDYKKSNNGKIWVAFEHPIPLVPNVMLKASFLDGKGSIKQQNTTTHVKTDLSHLDAVLYYELLDNDIVSLDAGAAYRKMQGDLALSTMDNAIDINKGIVMAYAAAKASAPGVDLFAFADVEVGLNERETYDYSIGIGYTFDGIVADYNLRAGYREFNFDVDRFSGVNAKTKADGIFLGLEIDF